MAKEFLGVGWKFPVQVDNTGKVALSKFEEDIRESIRIILGTSKGERVMRPDFGCGVHDYVFGSMNTTTIGLIESSVREALIRWELRIELLNVQVSTDEAELGRLLVGVNYRVRATNNEFNFVYPFYLTER
ncbi:MAG: GPW/gp25 family protein [Anaerolineae bacterium]|nr:GPW/gp25 family protein [Anaerolineae bacterium]